jgi:SAM-dependent methyltransferase
MQQAPLEYVHRYYNSFHRRRADFPIEAAFSYLGLSQINGPAVLNVGCGPQFYDHVLQFENAPRDYLGIDVNAATVEFLRSDIDPRITAAREAVAARGTSCELRAADIFLRDPALNGRFDWIMGSGVFATFYGDRLRELLPVMCAALRPGGRLLKTTWHGPLRTPGETADKLRYGFDTTADPTADDLIEVFAASGLTTRLDIRHTCEDPAYGWQQIQTCVFQLNN